MPDPTPSPTAPTPAPVEHTCSCCRFKCEDGWVFAGDGTHRCVTCNPLAPAATSGGEGEGTDWKAKYLAEREYSAGLAYQMAEAKAGEWKGLRTQIETLQGTVAALRADLAAAVAMLPASFYADRDLPTRVQFMVEQWQKVLPLANVAEEAVVLVRAVEWGGVACRCMFCGGLMAHGHAPDCRLAALLAKGGT